MGNASKILRRFLIGFALTVVACVFLVIMYFVVFFGMIGYRMEPREPYYPMESLRAAAPAWTPDGSRIVFGHWGGVYAVNQDGSALNRIHGSGVEDDLYDTPTIYEDGSRIAYSKYQRDRRWERLSSALDGSDVRETSEDFDRRRGANNYPWSAPYSVSPNGSRIAFVEGEKRGDEYVKVLYTSEYAGEYPKEEARADWTKLAEGGIESPRWSPDGSRIAFVEIDSVPGDNRSYLYSTRVVSPDGSGLATVHQTVSAGRHETGGAAWSPDGTKLLIYGSNSISVVNADGSGLTALVKLQYNSIRQLHPSWSPDGSKIAVYSGNPYQRALFVEGAVFTMSPDGSNKRVLAEYVADYETPLRRPQDQSLDQAFDVTPAP